MADDTGYPGWRRIHPLQMFAYFFSATAVVFYLDVVTPLGLSVWILYFIPLILTLYMRWRYAPYGAVGIFIVLIGASFFLSPLDIPLHYAVANRVFFALMLVVSAVFIARYRRNVELLLASEDRYRRLIEWSPEAVLVYRDGRILYVNPAAVELLRSGPADAVAGTSLLDLVEPVDRDRVTDAFRKALPGSPMEFTVVRMKRPDGSEIHIGVAGGYIDWDNAPAVQVIFREMPG